MSENNPPNYVLGPQSESLHVQLTRMEVTLGRVLERVTNLSGRMDKVEVRASELEVLTQRLDLDAQSRDKTAIALAIGVEKERSNAAEAILKEKNKDEKTWTPFTRFFAGLAAFVAVAMLIVGIAALWIQSRP